MAVNINWNALQPRDFGTGAVQYAQAGQEARQQQAKQNALSQYATNPDGAVEGLVAAGALNEANALQQFGARKAETAARTAAQPKIAAGDYAGAAKDVAGLSPEYAGQLLALDGKQRTAVLERANILGSAAYALDQIPDDAQRNAAYQQMVPQLRASGIDEQTLAGFQPTKDNLRLVIGQAMSVKDHIDKAQADRTFTAGRQDAADRQADRIADNERQARADAAREANADRRESRLVAAVGAAGGGGKAPSGYRWNEAGDLEAIPGGPRDPKAGGRAPQAEMQLRKEFDAQPEVKNFRTVATAARQVEALAKAPPSANNDIALIYSVMKAYDPTSVVRETEFATAQNAAGVPEKIKNQWNKVLKGERLNPSQRAEMARSVGTVARASGDRFATIADNYRGYAQQAGANPDHIVKYDRKVTRPASAGAPPTNAPGKAAPSQVMRFDAQGNPVK